MKLLKIIDIVIGMSASVERHRREEAQANSPDQDILEGIAAGLRREHELREFLHSLPEADVYWLTVIMYVGRGGFRAHELSAADKRIRDIFPKPAWAIDQLLGKAHLARQLARGRQRILNAGLDLDRVPG
jgi:hypothetical protein